MHTGERLSAYLAGELDAADREALERELAADPELRAQLDRIASVQALLDELPEPEPSEEFSARLRTAVTHELASTPPVVDELAERRARRRSLTPMLAAGAAAVVIAVVGVGAGFLLGGLGGGDDSGEQVAMEADQGAPSVPVVETDNDFTELTLRRVAFSLDTQFVIDDQATRDEAAPLADMLVGQLLRTGDDTVSTARGAGEAAPSAEMESADQPADALAEEVSPVERCLPTILSGATEPMVPAHVEVASYEGEPAVIYAFVTEEPDSGRYRRTEVWALAQDDCQVLGFAQFDR